MICTVFPHFGSFSGASGPPNAAIAKGRNDNPHASHPESPSQWEDASGGAEPTALPLLGRLGARQVPTRPLDRTCEGVQSSLSLTLPTEQVQENKEKVVQGGERKDPPLWSRGGWP